MLQVNGAFNQTCNTKEQFAFYYTNGYLHESLPVITQENPDDITWMKWGLVPNNLKDINKMEEHLKMFYSLFSKEEELNTSAYTRHSVTRNRCLIPATGFFVAKAVKQWNFMAKEEREEKYPYLVQLLDFDSGNNTMPFCFPGIYNLWKDERTGAEHLGFLTLTTKAWENDLMMAFSGKEKNSERMPCILAYDQYNEWLDPTKNEEDVEAYLYPFDAEWMQAYSINRKLNNWKTDHNNATTLLFNPYKVLGDTAKMNTIF